MKDTKTVPTRSQVETLMSDWLEGTRDADTFVHKNTDGAIRRQAAGGRALSEYVRGDLSEADPADVLRQAREIAQSVVNGMTDTPIRVTLGTGASYTDGETICVSSDYFDDKDLSTGEKVDILTGFAIHEACHIRHTDFGPKGRRRDADAEIARLKRDIDNILEDERIEHLLGESVDNGGDGMPGLSDYLGRCKRHAFGKYAGARGADAPTEPLPRLLDALLSAVRYPAALTEEMVTENFDELDAIRRILRPFPKSPTGVRDATDRIVDVIRDMVEKKGGEQHQDGGGGRDQSGGQPGNGSPQQGSPSSLTSALRTSQAQKILTAAEKANNAPDGKSNSDAKCIRGQDDCDYVNGDCEKDTGGGAGGTNSVTYIRPARGSQARYIAAHNAIKRYVPAMAKALRCKTNERDYILQGEKSGKLNTNKLVCLKVGNPDIFTKRGSVTTDSACLCLLLDESGSMSGDRRLEGTRQAAVLINEAVSHIRNLQLFIYGFGENQLTVYRETGREGRWTLGSTSAHGGTPTAEAMRISAERVRRHTDDSCLMIILTDGEPNDRMATMQQDRELPRRGILPIGVDISGADAVKKVFRNSISINDMQALAPSLAEFVKKKLSKTLRRHDSQDQR